MKKNDECVSEAEIQKTMATLISLNRLEEQGIGTKSYFYSLSSWECFGIANADYGWGWTKPLRIGKSNHWWDSVGFEKVIALSIV